jgi:3-deoxy-7-phosphoheptulonate synthase
MKCVMVNPEFKASQFFIMGPCSLESWEQIRPIASLAAKYQVPYLRTPLFKPRTHPDSFQGLGSEGIQILEKIRGDYPALQFVSEICSLEHLKQIQGKVEMLQIGARNMQNFELLKDIGKNHSGEMVMLKRGFSNTLREWLSAAQYLIDYGVSKDKLILCERGTRNAQSPTGVTLDFGMAIKAKQLTGYHTIIDPSHGTAEASLVLPLAKAAMSLPFDGVMIECHPEPKASVSDAGQALSLEEMEMFLNDYI